ncbi:hypothetical protein [Sphingobium aquiterrae]|uniref:hypothetical protein n=1 Tax=Sphingobium aquiterrae TaxID=2038656 RepID=UPI0030182EE6
MTSVETTDRGSAMDGQQPIGESVTMPVAPPAALPARRRSRGPLLAILLLLGFAAGVAVTVLALPKIRQWWSPQVTQPGALPMVDTRQAAAQRPLNATSLDLLELRAAELDDRLTRINVEAQAASGNAARAEGLLVAFAARRALDNGQPLGYIEGQIRLRFGQAQPRAVATIINASREPVTLVDLQADLAEIAPDLSVSPQTDWWSALVREVDGLVTIRRTTSPSPVSDQAYQRARRLIESGRVDAALTEVERMPGHAAADRWLQMARRYREARRALDLIETAAILEPRQIRTGTGAVVTQTSPLAP